MFELGSWELLLILVVALLVIGPKQLPSIAQSVGRWLRYFRNLLRGLSADVNQHTTSQSTHKEDEHV